MNETRQPGRGSKGGKKASKVENQPVRDQKTTPANVGVQSQQSPRPAEPKKKATTVTGHEPVGTPAGKTEQAGAANQRLDSVVERNGRMVVTPEQRWLMIAEAAYYRAERRGFSTEGSEQDWYEAEKEICAAYCTPEEQ